MKVTWALFALILILAAVNSDVLQTEQRHIVLCLKNIITRNFTPDRPVYITFPSLNEAYAPNTVRRQLAFKPPKRNYQRVIDALAETLNDDMKWQLILLETQYNGPGAFSSYTLPKSYPTAVQCVLFIWQAKNDKYGVITYADQMTMLNPNKSILKKYVAVVLDVMNKPKLLQFVSFILAPLSVVGNNIFLMPQRRRRNIGAHIDVYTWFPYRFPEICGSYNHPVIIDIWIEDAVGRFQNNATLFPNKVPKHFGGCPIVVTKFKLHQTSITKIEEYILDQIFNLLNVTPATSKMVKNASATYTDVAYGSVYLDISSSESFFKKYSYPTPHKNTKLRWFIPCPKSNPRQGKFYEVFTLPVWFIMSLTFLLAGLTDWCIHWIEIHFAAGSVSHDTSSGFCNLWAAFLSVGVNALPSTTRLRVFFLSWVIYSFAMSTIFQALFTSYLVDPGKTQEINTLEEFTRSGLDYFAERGNFINWCSFREYIGFCDSIKYYPIIPEMKLRNGTSYPMLDGIQAMLLRSAKLQNISVLANDLQAEMFKFLVMPGYKLCSVRDLTVPSTFAFVMTTDNVYLKPINDLLRQLRDTGLLERFQKNFIFKTTGGYYSSMRDHYDYYNIELSPESDYFVFTLSHMKVSFYLLLMGYILGLFVFLGEVNYSKFDKYLKSPTRSVRPDSVP